MNKRNTITALLTSAQAPGISATAIADQLGMSLGAVMGHIQHLRKVWQVVAQKHPADGRVRTYRITGPKPGAAAAQAKSQTTAAKKAKPAPLSAEQMEAAICSALRQHASPRHPMNMGTLCQHTAAPTALVRPAIIALVQRELVTRTKNGYHLQIAARITPQTVAAPREVNVMHAPRYDGAELRPFTGRVGAMDAFGLPSRGMGG